MEQDNQQSNSQETENSIMAETSLSSITVASGNILDSLPSRRIQEFIRQFGTSEQIAKLDKLIAENPDLINNWDEKSLSPSAKNYLKQFKLPKLQEKPGSDKMAYNYESAMKDIARQLRRRGKAPEAITYDFTRSIFWGTYRMIVKAERGVDVKPETIKSEPEFAKAMSNICHWIIDSDEGDFDPRSSLYLYGQLGVGKSTLAKAAYEVLRFFKNKMDWESNYLSYVSMDQAFLTLASQENISFLGGLRYGNWVLDEIKAEHATYKHYGNELNILGLVLLARHDLWKQSGARTIITTNIGPSKLAELIAASEEDALRLADRLKQEYIPVKIEGDNKRKPKYLL